MPSVVVVLPLAILASFALGGRVRGLEAAPLRATWLLVVGLGAQFGLTVAVGLGLLPVTWASGWAPVVVGQGAVIAWLVVHRHLAGTGLLLLGVLTGLAGVVAPLGPSVGLATAPEDLPLAALLAARVPVPSLPLTVSLGDLITGAGVIRFTHAVLTSRTPAERRRLAAARASTDATTPAAS